MSIYIVVTTNCRSKRFFSKHTVMFACSSARQSLRVRLFVRSAVDPIRLFVRLVVADVGVGRPVARRPRRFGLNIWNKQTNIFYHLAMTAKTFFGPCGSTGHHFWIVQTGLVRTRNPLHNLSMQAASLRDTSRLGAQIIKRISGKVSASHHWNRDVSTAVSSV